MFHSFQLHYSFKVVPTPQEKQCPGNAVQNAAMAFDIRFRFHMV